MFESRAAAKRENKRKSLFYKFEILDNKDQKIGFLGDLTLNGLKIISESPITTEKILKLKIKVPSRINKNEQIVLDAECMWCRKQADTNTYHSGWKTVHLDDQDKNTVKIIIDLLSSPDDLIL